MIRLATCVGIALAVAAVLVAQCLPATSRFQSAGSTVWDFASLSADTQRQTNSTPVAGRATAIAQSSCTAQVADPQQLTTALSSRSPRICVTASLTNTRLNITTSGSDHPPMMVIGTGQTVVKGITVKGDNVLVTGFQVVGTQRPALRSPEIISPALFNNTVKHPTGGDCDGIRFFGNHLSIVHNTITDISPDGSGAHADCMQTFTSGGGPPANNILISENRCDNIDNQCIMAEGPEDVGDGGGGPGEIA